MNQKNEIVEKLFVRFYRVYPHLEKFGENGMKRTKEDLFYHFQYLETAFSLKDPKIFRDYVIWLGEVLETRGGGQSLLFVNLAWLVEEIEQLDETVEHQFYLEILKEGMELLRGE